MASASDSPSVSPSGSPSSSPSASPSGSPSSSPSGSPSSSPSASPSGSPSSSPSKSPSSSPSVSPSGSPSVSPSASPSASPSPVPAGLVEYTVHSRNRLGKKYFNFVQIVFGGGNEAYPTGGVALTTMDMGLRSDVDAVIVLETNCSGYQYEWDRSANTLRIMSSGTELSEGEIPAEQTVEALVIGW